MKSSCFLGLLTSSSGIASILNFYYELSGKFGSFVGIAIEARFEPVVRSFDFCRFIEFIEEEACIVEVCKLLLDLCALLPANDDLEGFGISGLPFLIEFCLPAKFAADEP